MYDYKIKEDLKNDFWSLITKSPAYLIKEIDDIFVPFYIVPPFTNDPVEDLTSLAADLLYNRSYA